MEIIKDLRDLGVKIPIATTNTWGNNPLASLPALTTGDIIDVHVYGEPLELEKTLWWRRACITGWLLVKWPICP